MSTEQNGNAVVLALSGRLDGTTSPTLDSELSQLIDTNPVTIIDMGGLDYVSSAGLRILLKGAKQAKGKAKLMLCALHPQVQEVFDISGFTSIFTIHPTRAAAVAAA